MGNSNKEIVADAIADELALAGVDRVFGLPGGEVVQIMDSLRRRGIEFVLCRHEADAGMMAAVYGKLKGTTGVVLTTLGPGAANLMLPLSNSYLDREPLLAISADIPASWPASHTHQRLPLHEVYGPVTKMTETVTGFNVRSAVRRAVAATTEEPLGTALLTVSAEVSASPSFVDPFGDEQPSALGDVPAAFLKKGDVGQAVAAFQERIAQAERPVVLLGLGARAKNAAAIREWLEAWNLPVAVTPKVKGIVDETASNFLGVVGGMSVDALMNEALQHSDLLIGFGFDPVELDKTWHAELPFVWVLESPQACGVIPSQNLIAVEHAAMLEKLTELPPPRQRDDAFADFRKRRASYLEDIPDTAAGTVYPTAIVRSLIPELPPETIVATDVGSHKYLFGQFWPSRNPETFYMSNGLSGMGYGLPVAIGAKLARPDAPVLAVVGDGGFSMNSQELETAKRYGAEVIVLVLADKSYSLIRHGQEKRGLQNYGVDFNPIDSIGIAEACGVPGVRASTEAEIAAAVSKAAKDNTSLVVEIPVDPDAWRPLV